MSPSHNILLAERLLLQAEKEKHQNFFKYRAYRNAADIVSNFSTDIDYSSQLSNIPGIGPSIRQKIDLILQEIKEATNPHYPNTHTPNNPNSDNSPEDDILETFRKIYGVGEKKARELLEKHNIKDLLTLRARQDELLNEKQRIGLKYYDPLLERIPREEMKIHHTMITRILHNEISLQNHPYTFEIVGSYRRGAESSGDIDVLITFEEGLNLMGEIVKAMRRCSYVVESLAEGPKKFMGICCLPGLKRSNPKIKTPTSTSKTNTSPTPSKTNTSPSKANTSTSSPSNKELSRYCRYRRIDIIWCPRDEYPFALFYFTGSERYNRYVREVAAKKGYRLNEKELIFLQQSAQKDEKPVVFQSEKDITDFLGLPYLPPEKRN